MLVDRFLRYLEFEKRYSKHTLNAYKTDLLQFEIYLQSQNYSGIDTEVSHFIIRSWLVSLIEAQLNTRSVNRKITTLKSFYKFLIRENLILKNPMAKVQSPKTAKRLPVFVDKIKMNALLENNAETHSFIDKRNNLIIELFYQTGIRVSELTSLSVTNTHSNSIKVLGKRNKERIIPIMNSLSSTIENYLTERIIIINDHKLNHDLLLINKNGKPVTRFEVYKLIKEKLGTVTSLEKRSPHVLRHTFATHMLDNGADINAIKEILGHASLAATQVYTHNTIEKLKNIHKQAHPKP